MEVIDTETEEVTQTDWMNGVEVITENTKDEWCSRRNCNGDIGNIEDLIETQLEKIRNVVTEKNGSVSDEVNEVLDTYEMEQKGTYEELEVLYGNVRDYEGDIEERIVEVKNYIIELLEK